MRQTKIKLNGKLKEALGDRSDLLLIGDKNAGCPIATIEQYENFTESTAFLTKSGNVMQHRRVIGHVSDIEEVEIH